LRRSLESKASRRGQSGLTQPNGGSFTHFKYVGAPVKDDGWVSNCQVLWIGRFDQAANAEAILNAIQKTGSPARTT